MTVKPRTMLESFLAEEIQKSKGISYPVKAGFLRRVFIRSLPCSKLHPNPGDEFCDPNIGPNYEIISRYKKDFGILRKGQDFPLQNSSVCEPIIVEKISPEGYMILNGHHRWAAARSVGAKKLRVRIVDLTLESDIRKMLNSSGFDRKVTLDLDEVVFRPETDPFLEKPLPFPLKRIYRERLRLGIPALFHMLNNRGYDIWVYTAGNISMEYLRHYFRHYRIHVTGIVTGTARKTPDGDNTRETLRKAFDSKYTSTVHISEDAVVRTFRGSKDYDEIRLNGSSETWSKDVMNAFEE